MLDGICLVISPLLALMQDQVENLKRKNIPAIALNTPRSQEDLIILFDNIVHRNIKFLYVSPEKLQSRFIQEKIKQLPISFIAIDEAHCISEWGHDFRPSYLQLQILNEICPDVPKIGLTASATPKVLEDISKQLEMQSSVVYKKSFERKNLAYQVFEVENKFTKIKQIFDKVKAPAILYCQTRKETKSISDLLNNEGYSSTFYHGGLSNERKELAYQEWYTEQKTIMVATNAFGMGIDKSNIRIVIHIKPPNSIENYMQEAGRAGRDGHKAFAVTLLYKNDIDLFLKKIKDTEITIDFLKKIYLNLNQFYKISMGEMIEKEHDFSIETFCKKYNTRIPQTYNALKTLERHGVLCFHEGFHKKSSLKFISNSNHVLNYCEHNRSLEKVTKTILRNYPGIFENFATLNEYSVCKQLQITSETLRSQLSILEKNGLVVYMPQNKNTRIQFLVPREDGISINRISKKIKEQAYQKVNKAEAIASYFMNNNSCRSEQLLTYFEDYQTEACGICDVCLSKKNKNYKKEPIAIAIVTLLKKHLELSSQQLIDKSSLPETQVLTVLRNLIEERKILITDSNTYRWIPKGK
jgi:ATP-dependent DNA helicase RecQ